MRALRHALLAASLAFFPSIASAVLIESLDFTNNGSDWSITTNDGGLPLVFEKGGDPTKVGFEHPNTTGTGHYNLFQEIAAPAGFSMSNIRLEALGSGFSSWIMDGRIGMGFAPTTSTLLFDYSAYIGAEYNGQVVVDQPLLLDATGDATLGGLTSIHVGVEVVKGLSHVSQHADISQMNLYADLTPLPVIPGAREPLSFKNSGLYGPWNGYFVNPATPFDHHVVQAVANEGDVPAHAAWNTLLQQARTGGKRIIADLIPQASDGAGGFFGINDLTPSSPDSDIDKLAAVVDEFFTQVDKNELYAITLGEEHIFWNGRVDHLNKLYDKIKVNHPNLPIFQWYTPSSIGTAPGVSGFYNLNSDGWVSDEYFLDQPVMEKNTRAYVIQQKPITNVIWAGGDANSVPFIQERFDDQVSVHQKYDVPAGYFTWSGNGPWGWDPDVDPVTAARFEIVKNTATATASDPGPDFTSWDTVPWEIPTIELAFLSTSDVTPFYAEDYISDRVLRFINETDITGFSHLRWDSSAVELRPRETGAATSSVAYNFSSAFPLTELRIDAPGFVTPGTDGAVSLSVLDMQGNVLQTTNMSAGGAMNMIVPGGLFPGREFQVVYSMTGTSVTVGDVLAGVDSIDVDADVVIPTQKAIDLEIGAGGAVSFEEDLSGMSIFHTAEFNNIGKVAYSNAGLLANINPGQLEVIQEFATPQDIGLTELRAVGAADQNNPSFLATIGIGISLDGINIIDQVTSSGTFDGELLLDLTSQSIESDSFFVHLLLDGSFGLIESYTLAGIGLGIDGDFDGDGDVDGSDFLLWQRNPAVGSLGDWQTNYGMTSNLSASQANVPEPTTAVLLGVVLTTWTLINRRRRN